MKKLFFTLVSFGVLILIGCVIFGVVGLIMNPEGYQEHVDDAGRRREQAKVKAEYLSHFKLSQDEKLEHLRTVENAVQQQYQNEAIIGVIVFERIDKNPNGNTVRYVVDKRIKVPGKIRMRQAKLRAMLVVEYEKGGSREVSLQFVNVDGTRVN